MTNPTARGLITIAILLMTVGLATAGLFGPADAPKAELINPAAYQRLTHILVVAGNDNYRPVREELLSGIEDGLEDPSCWAIMPHDLASEKLNGISLDPPAPPRWGNDAEVSSQLLTLIPKRRHQLGVLVFWVRNWDGSVYDNDAKTGYARDAVAELYDSASGHPIWRGHMALPLEAPAEAETDAGIRAARTKEEEDQFVSFFVDNLVHPQELAEACVARPEVALMGARPQEEAAAEDPNVPLIAALKSDDPAARARAAKALGQKDNDEAVGPLIAALSDPEPKVRAYALDALGEVGSIAAVDAVTPKLKDPNRLVRALAVRTLGRIGSNKAVPALNELMKAEKEPAIRKMAEQALARINDPTNLTNLVIEIPSDWKDIELP